MKKVLLIEDNAAFSEELNDALKFEGFETIIAGTGEAGLDEVCKHYPDIILCDILLPDISGFEVYKKLKKEDALRNTPFLFITSLADRESYRTGMELGADDFITKPFTVKEITSAINTRLEKYNTMQLEASLTNIEKKLESRLKSLRSLMERQKDHLKEISDEKEELKSKYNTLKLELLNEVTKSVETKNTLLIIKKQVEGKIKEYRNSRDLQILFKDILIKIDRISNKKNNLLIFQLRFNIIHPEFLSRILRHFHDLSQIELTLLCTIALNLNSTQVAALLNISPDSVRKSRYRLRKKLNLGPHDSLINFVHRYL